jgi:hypothetical protein
MELCSFSLAHVKTGKKWRFLIRSHFQSDIEKTFGLQRQIHSTEGTPIRKDLDMKTLVLETFVSDDSGDEIVRPTYTHPLVQKSNFYLSIRS